MVIPPKCIQSSDGASQSFTYCEREDNCHRYCIAIISQRQGAIKYMYLVNKAMTNHYELCYHDPDMTFSEI